MNDLEKISDANALIEAFNKAKKSSNWKSSVQMYEVNLLTNIVELQKELRAGVYKQRPFKEFDINERGKQRHIKAIDIRDRVVQRSLCDNVLVPKLRKYLIYDNGASLAGKGVDFARKRFVAHLQKFQRKYGNDGYVLQIDMKNFFGSIPQDKMIAMLEYYLDDESIFPLIEHIIYSFGNNGIGMGIGSHISQICGMLYPVPIDNYCKIVKGCKYYGRFQDDFYVIHNDIRFLKELLQDVIQIADGLGLQINFKKTQIIKLTHSITFLQIKHKIVGKKIIRTLSRSSVTRERRKLKSYFTKLSNGTMTYKEILNAYKSWKFAKLNLAVRHSIRNLDLLFDKLFNNNFIGGITYDKRYVRIPNPMFTS